MLAPGVERIGSGAGARDVSDRADIGVLALIGSFGQTAGARRTLDMMICDMCSPRPVVKGQSQGIAR